MRLPARRISPGRATGFAIVSSCPFSFVGGADAASGKILDKEYSGTTGKRLAGHVFAFPTGKGSTVGSYALYGLVKRKVGPIAIVNERAEAIVAVGAILAEIPMVDEIDLGAFLTGDRTIVDADRGRVDLPDVNAVPVVTAVLRHRGRVLLVRRSRRVGSFRGRWSAISGYIEGHEDPRERALQEIREETRIAGARLRRSGRPVITRDGNRAYVVHPFLFDVPGRRVSLDWENVAFRWIAPNRIDSFRTVPRLKDVLVRVLSTE
jgi:uncharacterized protein